LEPRVAKTLGNETLNKKEERCKRWLPADWPTLTAFDTGRLLVTQGCRQLQTLL